jgi:hypothetical protein
VVNGLRVFEYLWLSPWSWLVLVLAVSGWLTLVHQGRRLLAALTLITPLVNIALTAMHKYPFGGVRQCVYLLPFVALAAGGAVQSVWDRFRSTAENAAMTRGFEPSQRQLARLTWAAAAVVVVMIAWAATGITQAHFWRTVDGPGWGELPVRESELRDGLAFLNDRVANSDILVAERQTTFYARFPGRRQPEELSKTVSRYELGGFPIYYSNQNFTFFFRSAEIMWKSLGDIMKHTAVPDDSTVWIVSVGWPNIRSVVGGLVCGPLMVDGWSRGGVGIYGLNAGEIRAELARRRAAGMTTGDERASPGS